MGLDQIPDQTTRAPLNPRQNQDGHLRLPLADDVIVVSLAVHEVDSMSMKGELARLFGNEFEYGRLVPPANTPLYSEMHCIKLHGQKLALKMIGGAMSGYGTYPSEELERKDYASLCFGKQTASPYLPEVVHGLRDREGNLVGIMTRWIDGLVPLTELATLPDFDPAQAKREMLEVLRSFGPERSDGLHYWDPNPTNWCKTPEGFWILIDPGALTSDPPKDTTMEENVDFTLKNAAEHARYKAIKEAHQTAAA